MRMSLVVLMAGLLLVQGLSVQAQPSGSTAPSPLAKALFLKTTANCTVTVTKHGRVVASLSFPEGTYLSAYDEDQQVPRIEGGGFQFHGSFELRALPGAEITPGPAHLTMERAPVVLRADGVDVTIVNAPAGR